MLHICLACFFTVFFLCRKLRLRSFRIRYWICRTAKLLAFLLSKNVHYLEFGMYKIWFRQIYYLSCSPDPIHKQFQTANSNNVYPNVLHIYLVCSFIVCFLWTKLRIRSFRICHWICRTAKQLALLISNCSNQFRSFVYYSYCSLDPTTNYETKNSSSIFD